MLKKSKIIGKKRIEYKIALQPRGHVNCIYFDIIVKFRKCIVERLGYGRIFKKNFIYLLAGDRLAFWIKNDIKFTNGFKKHLKKTTAGLI